jgi:hypothetical protein
MVQEDIGPLGAQENPVEKLSNEFTNLLNAVLDEGEMEEIRSRTDPGSSACVTHDYLDSNEVMAAAFENVFGREIDPGSQEDADLWNKAWSLSKKRYFKV